jgi:hypothetical protein
MTLSATMVLSGICAPRTVTVSPFLMALHPGSNVVLAVVRTGVFLSKVNEIFGQPPFN